MDFAFSRNARHRRVMGAHFAFASPPAPYSGEPLVQLNSVAGRLWCLQSDEVVRAYIQNSGEWDPDEGRFLVDVMPKGGSFVDVGAHIGYFTCLIARKVKGASVMSFEPHPVNSHLLSLNSWENGGDIVTHAFALTSGARTVVLSSAEHNLGDTKTSSFVDEPATMVAPAVAFDELYPTATLDLVKIDVQGNELEVVMGMTRALMKSENPVVSLEFATGILRQRGLDPLAVLGEYKALGMRSLIREGKHLIRLPPEEIVDRCDVSGKDGQVDLVLTRR